VALRLLKQNYQDIERIIESDFVRATEAAALNSLRWLGRGRPVTGRMSSQQLKNFYYGTRVTVPSNTAIAPRGTPATLDRKAATLLRRGG